MASPMASVEHLAFCAWKVDCCMLLVFFLVVVSLLLSFKLKCFTCLIALKSPMILVAEASSSLLDL